MSLVLVLDSQQRPLAPIHPGYARRLLTQKRAALFRRFPFTLILKQAGPSAIPAPLRLKIDPGSKTTGLVLVHDASGDVAWAAELIHRGEHIRKRIADRRAARRSRRQRKTRYRPARFNNRRKQKGWLAPSLESRIANVETWVARICRLAPVAALSQELGKFDTQLLEHPEISGIEYQQGTLAGYELRAYLLEKWGRQCAYCKKADVPLQIEHLAPKARGGSDRVSNLVLACKPCNQKKGTMTAAEFGYPELQAQAQRPLKDAAAMNATRWALFHRLKAMGLPLEVGTGGRTKWNRTRRGLPKTHWIDAGCVGASTPDILHIQDVYPLLITATGHGNRQMCGTNKYGFPIRHRKRQKQHYGFQTGDIVRAMAVTGKYAGIHSGRVVVRASGAFDIATTHGRVQGISHRYCAALYRCDGYSYQRGERGCLSTP